MYVVQCMALAEGDTLSILNLIGGSDRIAHETAWCSGVEVRK